MKIRPKLIMLAGFAGCGKSTLAERYIADHPLALYVEGDEIITKLGQWRTHQTEAVKSKVALASGMAATHLRTGYDVIIPHLPGGDYDSTYENVAKEAGGEFLEVFIEVEKEEAIKRLLARGTWGEAGLPPITDKDLPRIDRLYDEMMEAVTQRPSTIIVRSTEGDVDGTYKALINVIS